MIPSLVDSKRVVTDVAVELSRSQAPPTLPFELRDYVSPNTWEARVSALTRLASQAYLIIIMALSFLVPITTYYVTLQSLEGTTDDVDRQVWLARFSCFAVTIATWIVLSAPMILWKYLGKVRVTRVADLWTRADALSAPSYWRCACLEGERPWVLVVTVPLIQKSHFDRDSYLPPVRTFSPWFALCTMN
ncbi:hypothetical protein EV363DRAFT_1395981 [Boletus edulis]|nr:hypothetical protein EV363DRAFT_1395981 [Boletus edulis]